MSDKKKIWTLHEEGVLKKCVKENKTLAEAFKEAAKQLGRTEKAIMGHYYYSKKHVLTLYTKEGSQKFVKPSTFSKIVFWIKKIFS